MCTLDVAPMGVHLIKPVISTGLLCTTHIFHMDTPRGHVLHSHPHNVTLAQPIIHFHLYIHVSSSAYLYITSLNKRSSSLHF